MRIAGAFVSVVVPHARAGAMTVALENDTRGAAVWAEGFGPTQAAAPTYPATERGVTAGDRFPRNAQAPNSCANLAPADVTNPAGAISGGRLIYAYDGEHKRRAILAIARQRIGKMMPSQRRIAALVGCTQPNAFWHIEKLREEGRLWLRLAIVGKQRRHIVERVT